MRERRAVLAAEPLVSRAWRSSIQESSAAGQRAERESRFAHEPERIRIRAAVQPYDLAVARHIAASSADAYRRRQAVRDEMRAEVIAETVWVDEAARQSGDLRTSLVKDERDVVAPERRGRGETGQPRSSDCDRLLPRGPHGLM